MKHILEAGTDAATLLLFDPAALPPDFDARVQQDGTDFFDQLTAQGLAYWINTSADGNYTLHAYVDEPVPDALGPHLRNAVTVDAFQAPSGRLYFAGAEYARPTVDAELERYPHMGASFTARPGTYRLTLSETEFPEGLDEEMLRGAVPAGAYGLHQSMGCFVWLAFLSAIGLGVTLFGLLWPWRYYLIPLFAAGIAWPFVLARLKPYRETNERYRAIQREHPGYVARLEYRGE
jgi:hypothetical protein